MVKIESKKIYILFVISFTVLFVCTISLITPAPVLKYAQATDDGEGGGENHGGSMETGDGGHGGGSNGDVETGDGGHGGGMETGDGGHGGTGEGATGFEGEDVGLGIQQNDASINQDSSIHDIDMDNNVKFGDDIAIVDQDNIADQDAANIGIQDQDLGEGTDFGGIGLGTGDKTALEKEIEEVLRAK